MSSLSALPIRVVVTKALNSGQWAQHAWLLAVIGATLFWALYISLRPATLAELSEFNGTVLEYQLSHGGKGGPRQSMTLRLADGSVLHVSPPVIRDQVDFRHNGYVGEPAYLLMSHYNTVYATRIGKRVLLTVEQARVRYSARRIIPGVIATSLSMLALVLAALTWSWPQVRAALRLPE